MVSLPIISLLKLIKVTINTKNLWWFTWSQSVSWWRQVQSHSRQPRHNLPQIYGGIKAVYPILIHPIDNFLTHPKISFSINEHWSSKCNKHKSKINKKRLVQINWRIFYINQSTKLMWTNMNTQPAPSPRSSTNLR